MKNELMIFEGREVEVFEWEGKILFNPKHVADCLDIADVNSSIRNFNEKQVIKLTNLDLHEMHIRKLNNAGEKFLTESGVYKLIFKSKKKEAEKFQDWITDEVLPTIRNKGKYDLIETKINAIEDEQEKNLRLTIYQYETIVKMNPTDVLSAMMLNNKKIELNSYMQQKSIEKLTQQMEDTNERLSNLYVIGDRIQFSREVNSTSRATGKSVKDIYNLVYRQLKDDYGIDLPKRVEKRREKIQEERLRQGKKLLSPNTLQQKVTGLIIADEEQIWNEMGKSLFKVKDTLLKNKRK